MRRRSRIRWWFKWGCLGLSLLTVIAWGFSFRSTGNHVLTIGQRLVGASLGDGYILLFTVVHPALSLDRLDSLHHRRHKITVLKYIGGVESGRGIILPLWNPFLLFALPTAFLFWCDRRVPSGHCQKCGYNLTRNTSGICPECGEGI
jgi:hypothetical protein